MTPKHLSWSQISMLSRCGEQYRRRYIEGEKIPPGLALLRGRATHHAIDLNLSEKMNGGDLLPLEAVYEAAGEAFDAEVEDGNFVADGNYEDMGIEEAKGSAKDESIALAGLHATDVAPEIAPTAVEHKITVAPSDVLPVPFVAILDVIDHGTQIRDTKTAQKSPTRTTADDSDQLTSQGMAFAAEFGQDPSTLRLDYLVRTPKRGDLKYVSLETTRSPEDGQAFLHRAQAALRTIEAEIFLPAPTDSWACSEKFCGYAASCRYFRGAKRSTT